MTAHPLLELGRAAREQRPLPPDLADWLSEGIERYLSGEACTLDEALSVKGSCGRRTLAGEWRQQQRDHWLRRAADCIEAASPWQTALKLEHEVERFEARIWPRWRSLDEPPAGSSELRRCLFLAFKTGEAVPTSARQLHRLTGNGGFVDTADGPD